MIIKNKLDGTQIDSLINMKGFKQRLHINKIVTIASHFFIDFRYLD